jgi:hypothetical protein
MRRAAHLYETCTARAVIGFVLAFLSAGALALALALAYAELRAAGVLPAQLAALLVAPLLVGTAIAVAAAGVRAVPVRSPAAGGAAVLLAAALAGVLGWVLRVWSLPPVDGPRTLPLDPGELGARVVQLGDGIQLGFVSLSGPWVWQLFAAETLLLAAIAVGVARALYRVPVCPRCRRWCRREVGVLNLRDARADELVARLAARDWPWVRALGRSSPKARRWVRLDLDSCPCGGIAALSASHLRSPRPPRVLARHMLLGSDDLRTVRWLSRASAA